MTIFGHCFFFSNLYFLEETNIQAIIIILHVCWNSVLYSLLRKVMMESELLDFCTGHWRGFSLLKGRCSVTPQVYASFTRLDLVTCLVIRRNRNVSHFHSFFVSAYSDKGLAFEINSAVISASMEPKPLSKLNTPVIIASANIHEVDVSWSMCFLYLVIKNQFTKLTCYFPDLWKLRSAVISPAYKHIHRQTCPRRGQRCRFFLRMMYTK